LPGLLSAEQLGQLQDAVQAVHAAPALLDYLQDLIDATRKGSWFGQGLSPRAGMAVLRAAKAQAFLEGRYFVAPDDLRQVLPFTVARRLMPAADSGRTALQQVEALLRAVTLP
jgi:MoxR-like ATPase